MEAIDVGLGCCKLSWRPVSKNQSERAQRRMIRTRCEAHDKDHMGRSVDENMIVLRLRIKEMKMLETNQEAPSNWMEWEKQYYTHYYDDVFQMMGLLQSYLMSLRPSVALGMLAFVAFSVLISSGVSLFQAMEIAKRLLISFFGESSR